MKHIRIFESFKIEDMVTFKYNKGDYVKYKWNKGYMFIIDDVDNFDYYKPYLIKIHDDPDALIPGNNYWVKEDELYTDEETKFYQNQNKYNL